MDGGEFIFILEIKISELIGGVFFVRSFRKGGRVM